MARLLFLAVALLAVSQLCVAGSRRELWNADTQVEMLLQFLKKNGFSTLAGLLQKKGLDNLLDKAIQKGNKFTLLAPNDVAFTNLPQCNLDIKNVLLDHIIPKYLPEKVILHAPLGSTVPTLGEDTLIKKTNNPIILKLTREVQVRNHGLFAHALDLDQQGNQAGQVIGNQGNRPLSNNNVDVSNVNNGNINNINVNGNNNNVQVNNLDLGDDAYVLDDNENFIHVDDNDVADRPDGIRAVRTKIIKLNIFRKFSIVVHEIDAVLALCEKH